jgi:hypothetical protein
MAAPSYEELLAENQQLRQQPQQLRRACDELRPITAQLRKVVENPALADPGEYRFEVLAAAEVLAVVCEGINAYPPPSELVEQCRDVCLRAWDEGIDKLDPRPRYKEERRAVIAATFERLLKVCRHWESL